MAKQLKSAQPLVMLSKQTGVNVIPSDTLLTRLNYYDGKFLRAEDLQTEQRYLRNLVQLSNQTGGSGIAHGYDVMLSGGGDTLNVGPGLAIDPAGRVLLLPQVVTLNIQELIEHSKQVFKSLKAAEKGSGSVFDDCEFVSETPPGITPQSGDFYLITISHAEAYCGQEDVYGQLCKEACASSTDRPYIVEGLVIRAEPLQLETLLAQSKTVMLTQKHLRSQVASAYFNDERNRIKSLISKAGIGSNVWCFGAQPGGDGSVPIALLARAGQSTLFLDAWTARRELIDTPAKRYWQWRMAMRPWDVFLAHILQFQCQLSDLFKSTPDPGAEDPCKDELELLAEAEIAIAQINDYFAQVSSKLASLDFGANAATIKETLNLSQANVAKYGVMQKKFEIAKATAYIGKFDHILINGGIVELPSAGYLPVAPGSNVSVNQQVRRLLGDGLDLRFCIVRPDYVPHALEGAQHMERISLLEGLDHPEMKPEVDILVPGGELFEDKLTQAAGGFEGDVTFTTPLVLLISQLFNGEQEFEGNFESSGDADATSGDATGGHDEPVLFQGAARAERLPSGGGAFHISTWTEYELSAAQTVAPVKAADELVTPPAAGSKRGSAKQARKAVPKSAEAKANIYERLKVVAAQAISYYAQKRAAGAAGVSDNTAKMTNKPQVNTFRARSNRRTSSGEANAINMQGGTGTEAASGTKRAVGLWFTLKSELNIFELKQNQTASLDLRGVLAGPSQGQQNYIDSWLHGELLVTGSQDAGGERIVKGSMNVMAAFDLQIGGDTLKTSTTANFKVEARLKKEGQGHIVTLLLKHDQIPTGFGFDIKLNGDPLNVAAKIRFFDNRQNLDELMVRTKLSANPSVAQPGNPAHVKALSGIHTIATAKSNPSFTPNATALLFPPPPPPTEELVVRGTLDWVLFHRRRTRQCGLEPQAAPAVRRYNVYHALFDSDALEEIPERIEGIHSKFPTLPPSSVGEIIFPAGQVEFAGGGSTIADPNSLLETWEASEFDGAIFFGGIVSTGDALQDGQTLALARLANVRQVLTGKLPIHPQAQFDVLPSMPPFLAQQGVDGVILICTAKAEAKVQTMCHSVYHVRDSIMLTQMRAMILQGNIAGALKLADFLGVVNFDPEISNAPDLQSLQQVKQAWLAVSAIAPNGCLLVSPLGEDQTATVNKNQSEVIRASLGDNANFILSGVESQSPLPGGCPAISIFTPTQHKP